MLSPDDRPAEVARKVLDYLDAGTPRVWVADPEDETVTVYRRGGSRSLTVGDELTADDAGFEGDEFRLALRDVFGD